MTSPTQSRRSPRLGRIGLHLFLPAGPLPQALDEIRVLARQAVDAGFQLLSVGEHHGRTDGYLPNSWALAAALLTEHDEIDFGVYPFLVGLREPSLAAEEIELAFALHRDRVSIALGIGYADRDFLFAGRTRNEARRRMAETIDSLERTSDRDRNGAMDLLLAGGGPRTVELAAKHQLGLVLPPLQVRDLAITEARYRDAGGAGNIVVQCWIASKGGDGGVYKQLSSPWQPEASTVTSPHEIGELFERSAMIGGSRCELSVRLGGPATQTDEVRRLIDLCGDALVSAGRR